MSDLNQSKSQSIDSKTSQNQIPPLNPKLLSYSADYHYNYNNWKITNLAGQLSSLPVIFSHKGQSIIIVIDTIIYIYSLHQKTNKSAPHPLSSLKYHTKSITALALNTSNHLQLFSASHDHSIALWDIFTGSLIKTFQFHSIVSHLLSLKQYLCLVFNSNEIIFFNINTEEQIQIYTLPDNNPLISIVTDNKNDYLAFISSNNLYIYHISTRSTIIHKHEHRLYTIAFHPLGSFIAVGDHIGRIILWYNYSSSDSLSSTLHWHSYKVISLSFTEDGSYLLSGGMEGVLVVWQLNTGHKQFIPRLSSPISSISISSNGQYYGLTLDNNTFHLINSLSHSIEWSHIGLNYDNFLGEGIYRYSISLSHQYKVYTGLFYHSLSQCLVINGHKALVQFYSLSSDCLLTELMVTNRNVISGFQKKELPPPQLRFITFNHDCSLLSTIEHNPFLDEIKVILKIWTLSSPIISSSSYSPPIYTLHSQIPNPHSALLSSLLFHPSLPLLVTGDQDGYLKYWQLNEEKQQWKCTMHHQISHHSIHQCTYCDDQSLLLVASNHDVIIVSSHDLSSLHLFSHYEGPVERILYLHHSSRFLTHTSTSLYLYDLLSLSPLLSLSLSIDHWAIHPTSPFILLSFLSHLTLMDYNLVPLMIWNKIEILSASSPFSNLSFVTHLSQSSSDDPPFIPSFCYLDHCRRIVMYEPDTYPSDHLSSSHSISPSTSLFEKIYGQTTISSSSSTLSSSISSSLSSSLPLSSLRSIFNAPTHLLPPPSLSYYSLIKHYLPSYSSSSSTPQNDVIESQTISNTISSSYPSLKVSATPIDTTIDFSQVFQYLHKQSK